MVSTAFVKVSTDLVLYNPSISAFQGLQLLEDEFVDVFTGAVSSQIKV